MLTDMGFKDWIADAPTATWNGYVLRANGEIEKLAGADKGRYPLAGLTVDFDRGAELQSRYTATRILAIGVFALAFKKKKGGEYYFIVSGDNVSWMEEVPRKQVPKAMKFYQAVRAAQRKA